MIAERAADAGFPATHQLPAIRGAQRAFIRALRPDQLVGSFFIRQPVDDDLVVL